MAQASQLAHSGFCNLYVELIAASKASLKCRLACAQLPSMSVAPSPATVTVTAVIRCVMVAQVTTSRLCICQVQALGCRHDTSIAMHDDSRPPTCHSLMWSPSLTTQHSTPKRVVTDRSKAALFTAVKQGRLSGSQAQARWDSMTGAAAGGQQQVPDATAFWARATQLCLKLLGAGLEVLAAALAAAEAKAGELRRLQEQHGQLRRWQGRDLRWIDDNLRQLRILVGPV